MRRLAAIVLMLAAIASSSSLAVQPDELMKDPKLEARARELSRELRCMVCQNQSIDESDAPLARDLRLLVRERLTKGDTDQQVLNFLVARYGEFVLLKPPLERRTPQDPMTRRDEALAFVTSDETWQAPDWFARVAVDALNVRSGAGTG